MRLLSQIKKDLDFNRDLYNLIEVLKQIAISQYHILEKKLRTFDKIFFALDGFFSMIDATKTDNPLLNTTGRTPGVIAVTSDAGLLGGLNMQVMNLAIREVEECGGKLIIIGEKGQAYAADSKVNYVTFKGVVDETRFKQAQELRDYIFQEEINKRLGPLKIVYPVALSVVAQKVQTMQLLPFSLSSASNKQESAAVSFKDIIMESKEEDITSYLFYLLLGHKINEIFGLARLAELSARFSHLETSKTKIEQLNKDLRLQYFRQRHEVIDRNMRELFAARIVFANS